MTGKEQAFLWSEGGVTEQAAVKSKRMEIRPPAYTERIATKRREERTADNYGEERRHVYYYHGDHLGSAQVVTDYRGDVYEHIEYTPYGELWVEHAPEVEATPFRFTGKERDSETGLYYYGARYLNPQTGMWLSTDPAMGEYIPQAPLNDEAKKYNGNLPGMGGVFNTVNLHTYHYAGNNPVKYTDPNGREDDLPATKPSATNQSEGYNVGKSEFNHFQFSYLLVEGTGIGGSFTVQGQINIFQDAEGNYKANIDVFAFSYGASNAGDVEWFSSSYIKVDGKKVAEANLAIKPELKDKPNYIGSVTINLPSPKSNKDFTVHIKVNYKVTMPEGRAFPLFWYDRKVRIFKGSEK